VLGEVHVAVSNWRQVAFGPEVELPAVELDDFAPAFEHELMDAAAAQLGRWRRRDCRRRAYSSLRR
jgi:serine/threonine-protein kinase HipA